MTKLTRDEIVNSNSLEAQLAAKEVAEGRRLAKKSKINGLTATFDQMGRSYYIFCLEQALSNIQQARAIVSGDVVEKNHMLPQIEKLLTEAIDAS